MRAFPTSTPVRHALALIWLLLPLGCLLVRWSELPARVPIHFSFVGADRYGDKSALLALVLLPLLLYGSLQVIYPGTSPSRRRGRGAALFLSLVLSLWVASLPIG